MKIALQGHLTRGKEVIQILESLGGRNTFNYNGDFIRTAYFIGMDYSIYGFCTDSPKVGFKIYTLEEFEKEFPFKIGDEVIFPVKVGWASGKITSLTYIEDKLKYEVYTRTSGYHYVEPHKLSLYPMKEERYITLTLDKAKEWYKKGGELKEIALQTFTEKELTEIGLPKTWEEFCNDYSTKNGECYIGACSEMCILPEFNEGRDVETDKNVCPSQKSAEAHLAMIQLEQLRDCYRGLFVTVREMPVWSIHIYDGKPHIFQTMWGKNHSFLTFQSKEVAEEYLKNFKPLIEKAGDLI
jgi:hypothetical protein